MSMAYGTPLDWNASGFDFAGCEQAALASPQLIDETMMLWRVEAVSYAYIVNAEYDEWGSTDPRLEAFMIPVKKWTPHGATIFLTARHRDQWVDLRPGAKQWASRTLPEALQQLQDRRKRQIYILEKQLQRAQREHNLTLGPPVYAPPLPVPNLGDPI